MIRSIALALLPLLYLAAPASAEGDATAGEAAYAKACARCHKTASRITPFIEGKTAAEKAAWLDAFLAGHHATDAKIRAYLVAYLLAN
ncbi:MAG: hypothetical protein ACYC10_08190 [Allorhizobium sp.]